MLAQTWQRESLQSARLARGGLCPLDAVDDEVAAAVAAAAAAALVQA